MAKIKRKCGKKIIASEKDIVIKLAGTDSETPELGRLIENYDMATEINPQADQKAIRFIANYCYDLNIRLNRIDENLSVTSKNLADKVNFLETSKIKQIHDNPQSNNPLTNEEIHGLLHHEWDCACKICMSGRKKLESYLGV